MLVPKGKRKGCKTTSHTRTTEGQGSLRLPRCGKEGASHLFALNTRYRKYAPPT
jgi:hypothetical protein